MTVTLFLLYKLHFNINFHWVAELPPLRTMILIIKKIIIVLMWHNCKLGHFAEAFACRPLVVIWKLSFLGDKLCKIVLFSPGIGSELDAVVNIGVPQSLVLALMDVHILSINLLRCRLSSRIIYTRGICSFRKYPYPHHGGNRKFWRRGGSERKQNYRVCMEEKWSYRG